MFSFYKVIILYNFFILLHRMKKIIAFKKYYLDFISNLTDYERDKVKRALLLLESKDRIPSHYIRYLHDEIFEYRISCENKEFRLFFIFDEENLVILLNCYAKKTKKTPNKEIEKAIKLKKEYKNGKQ